MGYFTLFEKENHIQPKKKRNNNRTESPNALLFAPLSVFRLRPPSPPPWPVAGVARERSLSLRRPRRLSLLNRDIKRKRDEPPLSAQLRRRQGWGSDTSPSKQ
ncbi:hypothetical protein ES288_A08G011900v1 [Gossypium darwinii]|uniref:Uncharacterized protein n=1 Tax=Gossypium darwinii TaxID=34276 RepID=A0A5D2FIZ0_GOSDA|nr:hypothetical protein ES288_A08G011900v1 [Gossypium darwinii]